MLRVVFYFSSICLLFFWSYAVTYATHQITRIPTTVLENHTPYDQLYKEQPNLQNLKVFGLLQVCKEIDLS